MKKITLILISILFLVTKSVYAININEDIQLINTIGKNILSANHLPNAEFIITDSPDTFDDYFIKASFYKTVEMFSWELSFAKDKGELSAIIARQIGKISNNMPTVARSQSKTNEIVLTNKKGNEVMKFESKHIYSYEKLNKDSVSSAADRTAVDFLIQSENNPLALISVYGRYLDYDEDTATARIMNIYDYINYNFPEKLKSNYNTESYKKAMEIVNGQLKIRTEVDKLKIQDEQSKINTKKIKQANSPFKSMNPWNSSYTTLILHK